MADYIDKNILCQAYVHVELPEGMTENQLEEIKSQLSTFATLRGKFFVYDDVIVDVEFKEGSLKAYITIAGAIYIAIGQYGSFRSGVDFIYTDVKRLAESIVAECLFMTRARHEAIRRTEARTGVIGSLKILVDDMNQLEGSVGEISVEEAARRVKKIKDDADQLLINVRSDEDAAEIQNELDDFSTNLPDRWPHPPENRPDPLAIVSYYDAISDLRKSYGKKKTGSPKMPVRKIVDIKPEG
ncbi:MAG TPA: hypothetical protein VK742_04685 [Candidatus Sulfotelmatobacter sp.]|jgi:hypothetical protein|nr:hypothetical protein [Candidatus Sulfotelmatobacter sp.]